MTERKSEKERERMRQRQRQRERMRERQRETETEREKGERCSKLVVRQCSHRMNFSGNSFSGK